MGVSMLTLFAVALFLPLFPLSVVFNATLAKLRHPLLRFLLLLIWPQIGVLLLDQIHAAIPQWWVAWALASAAFYAVRLLSCRDLGRHAGFLASSALALAWGMAAAGADTATLSQFVLWMSLPPALLVLVDGALTRRFGAAFAGLTPGLGIGLPRLSGLLVVTMLAAIATPPFPGFFALLDLLNQLQGGSMVAVLTIWLIWGWAATRLIQGFITGEVRHDVIKDLSRRSTVIGSAVLVMLAGAGLFLTGGGL